MNFAFMETLDSETKIEFFGETIGSVVDYLKNLHNINIHIEMRALEDSGLTKDTELPDISLSGITLRNALNLILHDVGLSYTIANNVLLITTPEAAEQATETIVYNYSNEMGGGT